MFQFGWLPSCLRKIRLKRGFPHSETAGSQVACHLPDAIVDGNVLLRLKQPRHSLSALIKVALIYLYFVRLAADHSIHFSKNGGPERVRTADLFIANEVFFQLNYRPILSKKLAEPASLKVLLINPRFHAKGAFS